jgi:hypothetical protein
MTLKEQLESKKETLEIMYEHLKKAPQGSIGYIKWQIACLELEIKHIKKKYIKEQLKIGIILGFIAFGISVGLLYLTSYLAS